MKPKIVCLCGYMGTSTKSELEYARKKEKQIRFLQDPYHLSSEPQPVDIDYLNDIDKKYKELIYHVGRCFPNETRHETALRYIKEAEESALNSGYAVQSTPNIS